MSIKNFFIVLLIEVFPMLVYSQTLPKLIPYRVDDQWGYMDKAGKLVIPAKYSGAEPFSEGYAIVRIRVDRNTTKEGLIDESGKEFFTDLHYPSIGFSEGMTCVYVMEDKITQKGKYGCYDKTLKLVIPARYDYQFEFKDGLASVRLNGKYGCIDKTGKEIVPARYDYPFEFKNGLAQVDLNEKSGYVDMSGKEIIPIKYDYADNNFVEDLAVVSLNDKYGYIDKKGKEVIELKYNNVRDFSDGLACVQLNKNGKWGVINKNGKEVYPFEYDTAVDISKGVFYLKKNGENGSVFKNGKKITSLKYDVVNRFSEGMAEVQLNGKSGFIDMNFKEVVPPKYERVYSFSEGMAVVVLNKQYGYVNKMGKEIFPPSLNFNIAFNFKNGIGQVSYYHQYKGGSTALRSGYVDNKGKMYWDPEVIIAYTVLFRLGGKTAMESYVKSFMKKFYESGDRYLIELRSRIKIADTITKKLTNALCAIAGGDFPKEKPVNKISLSTRQWDMAKSLFMSSVNEFAVKKYEYNDLPELIDKAKNEYIIIEEATRQRTRN